MWEFKRNIVCNLNTKSSIIFTIRFFYFKYYTILHLLSLRVFRFILFRFLVPHTLFSLQNDLSSRTPCSSYLCFSVLSFKQRHQIQQNSKKYVGKTQFKFVFRCNLYSCILGIFLSLFSFFLHFLLSFLILQIGTHSLLA